MIPLRKPLPFVGQGKRRLLKMFHYLYRCLHNENLHVYIMQDII
jgi:hypothetical protein